MNVFITGISSGIGKELAKELIKHGHIVWGIARRQEQLKELEMEVNSERLIVSVCDVTLERSIKLVHKHMNKRRFIPDVVVLNAGVNITDTQPSFDLSAFAKNMNTNLYGALKWAEIFLPAFHKRKKGTFVAVSSMAAYRPGYLSIGYSASKAALSNAFRGLDVNFGSSSIKFITIHFGPIKTSLWPGPILPGMPSAKKAARFIIKTFDRRSGFHYYPPVLVAATWISGKLPSSWLRRGYNKWKV